MMHHVIMSDEQSDKDFIDEVCQRNVKLLILMNKAEDALEECITMYSSDEGKAMAEDFFSSLNNYRDNCLRARGPFPSARQ